MEHCLLILTSWLSDSPRENGSGGSGQLLCGTADATLPVQEHEGQGPKRAWLVSRSRGVTNLVVAFLGLVCSVLFCSGLVWPSSFFFFFFSSYVSLIIIFVKDGSPESNQLQTCLDRHVDIFK